MYTHIFRPLAHNAGWAFISMFFETNQAVLVYTLNYNDSMYITELVDQGQGQAANQYPLLTS